MIYEIKNKKIKILLINEMIQLPKTLKRSIDNNFEQIRKSGSNVWNGEIVCVDKCEITDTEVNIVCKKSNYAHYLYEERIGCPKNYECRNISAGCWIETIDGYYVIGELDETTSYPKMLHTTGGNIDKADILNGLINVEKTIKREAKEELNLEFEDSELVIYNGLNYLFVSDEGQQPGVQLFAKATVKMTAKEMNEHFEKYYKYLKENNLEVEFKRLHFLKRKNAIQELGNLKNPKRDYLVPLLQIDNKKILPVLEER